MPSKQPSPPLPSPPLQLPELLFHMVRSAHAELSRARHRHKSKLQSTSEDITHHEINGVRQAPRHKGECPRQRQPARPVGLSSSRGRSPPPIPEEKNAPPPPPFVWWNILLGVGISGRHTPPVDFRLPSSTVKKENRTARQCDARRGQASTRRTYRTDRSSKDI